MKNINQLITEITELTSNIESNYPELYRFLDENPLTIPAEVHPNIDLKVLQDYLESLKNLLRKHLESHSEALEWESLSISVKKEEVP